MHKGTLFLLAGLLTFNLGTADAQVTARQGVASPAETTEFESPMVLELPLPNVRSLDAASHMRLAEVRKYVCDRNVSLLNLTVAKRYKGPKKARSLELLVAGSVYVTESYDRRVDILLRLKSGEELLASQVLRNHKAEEGITSPFRIALPVDESKLLAAYDAATAPSLELTLTVRDDS